MSVNFCLMTTQKNTTVSLRASTDEAQDKQKAAAHNALPLLLTPVIKQTSGQLDPK